MKTLLHIRRHKIMSINSGGRRTIVAIAKRVDIRDPHVGSLSRVISQEVQEINCEETS